MSKPKTAGQWLAIPDDKLPTAFGEVLTPGPWKHDADMDRYGFGDCKKCGDRLGQKRSPEHCPVPDPIKIDWETAMEWFRKSHECYGHLREIYFIICQEAVNRSTSPWWMLYESQPKHYLIAAAMAAERKEE